MVKEHWSRSWNDVKSEPCKGLGEESSSQRGQQVQRPWVWYGDDKEVGVAGLELAKQSVAKDIRNNKAGAHLAL